MLCPELTSLEGVALSTCVRDWALDSGWVFYPSTLPRELLSWIRKYPEMVWSRKTIIVKSIIYISLLSINFACFHFFSSLITQSNFLGNTFIELSFLYSSWAYDANKSKIPHFLPPTSKLVYLSTQGALSHWAIR